MRSPAKDVPSTASGPLPIVVLASSAMTLAFCLGWWRGLRYFDHLQSSIVLDGGYRVFLGQEAFRDFLCPIGPVLFWLEAFSFKLFGVGYASHAALGGAMNAAAAGAVFLAAWRLERVPGLSFSASVVTGLWLMPMGGGGPTYTSGALFFVLMAAVILLFPVSVQALSGTRSRPEAERPGLLREGCWPAGAGAAGILAALACSVKQPVGAASALFLSLHLLAAGRGRDVAWLAAGFGAGLAGLGLAVGPDVWSVAWRHTVVLPSTGGLLQRNLASGTGLWLQPAAAAHFVLPLAGLIFIGRPADRSMLLALAGIQIVSAGLSVDQPHRFLPLIGLQYLLVCRGWRSWRADAGNHPWPVLLSGRSRVARESPVWAGGLLLVFVGLRAGFGDLLAPALLTPARSFIAAAGSAWVGCRLVLCAGLFPRFRRRVITALGSGAMLLGAVLAGRGLATAGPDDGAAWTWPEVRPLEIPFFRGVRLAAEVADGLERGYDYLSRLPARRGPVFVYQFDQVFYPALGQAPPQPFVWFDAGLTHRGDADAASVCGALASAKVGTMAMYDEGEGLPDEDGLPCLKRLVETGFVLDRVVPPLTMLRRRGP